MVTGSPTVSEGGQLTIAPDVTVRLAANRRLVIRGALTAQGLPTEPILFTGNGGGSWSDLYFQFGGSGTFDNCIIEQAGTGLNALGSGAISLSNTTIGDCNYGVYASGSSPMSFDSCLFQDNSYGLYVFGGSVELASCTFAGNSNYGFRGRGVAPVFVDAGNTFTGNGTGCYIQDVAAIDYTTPVTFTGNTDAGLRLSGCDQPAVDNMVFTGNTGAEGALVFADCGEFILGAGNVIGGSGQENSWPLTLGVGAFPSAASVIPVTGNTSNDIQVIAGSSARSGTWRKFAGLDYVVTGSPTVSEGGQLTIAPDVTVRLAANRRLVIRGALTALGLPAQPILFTGNGGGSWSDLYFQYGGTGTFDNCIIEQAGTGLYALGSGAISLSNTTIGDCNYGVYASGQSGLELTDSLISGCNEGLRLQGGPSADLVRCRIENNNRGISGVSGSFSLVRSEIVGNTDYGIQLSGAVPTFGQNAGEWNDIYGNGDGRPGRDLRNGPTDIEAHWIYWGTIDYDTILTRVQDYRDDPDLGLVSLLPFHNAAHDTPSAAGEEQMPDVSLPEAFALRQNAPNPFNPSTVISFDLPRPGRVSLKVYDLSGALVRTLVDGALPAGKHETAWQGRDDRGRAVSTGVYFYRIVAEDFHQTRRMTLLK